MGDPVLASQGFHAGLHHRAWRSRTAEARVHKRNTKVIGLSVDTVDDHQGWSQDIEDVTGQNVTFPMIGDYELNVSKLYNMLPAEETQTEGRTAATNATVRTVYLIGPDKKIKLMLIYPMSYGPQLPGDSPAARLHPVDGEASDRHPGELEPRRRMHHRPVAERRGRAQKLPGRSRTLKPYLRTVPQPQDEPVTEPAE